MSDLRRISVLGCLLLVVLRVSIGWQFLYEGLWKFDSFNTATPWTSAGYLKNSQGPLRDHFRNLAGDPDDFDWLDADKVAARWDNWQQQFVKHYRLDENDQRRLATLVDGPADYRVSLERLPAGVEFNGSLGSTISYDEEKQQLVLSGERHLLPQERDRLLGMVPLPEDPASADAELAKKYHAAVNRLFELGTRLSFKDRLRASLVGDPERAGTINDRYKGTVDYKRMGDIERYHVLLADYERNLGEAQVDFEREHAAWTQRNEIRTLHGALVGPVKALDAELKRSAQDLLSTEQLARGPVPLPLSKQETIDRMTMWSLTILGLLLIAGLFTRVAALAGAGMLLMFYLAMPPWPGVPELPGPEHSFIVNKNFIEALALLALAALPSGRWLGVDALLRRFLWRRPTD